MPITNMDSGIFFTLAISGEIPPVLDIHCPDIVWIPKDALSCAKKTNKNNTPLIFGCPIDHHDDVPVPLVSLTENDNLTVHFDVFAAIEGILKEHYHRGLEPTAEMSLPFNYSKVPPWIKSIARSIRKGAITTAPSINFPCSDTAAVVQWLSVLNHLAGHEPSAFLPVSSWPKGKKAALVVSHDVDTDWLFDNPKWIERICKLESSFGVQGAWYCVPMYSQGNNAERGLNHLKDLGCEIGCHGYNHDAKWPLLTGGSFQNRVDVVKRFRDRWDMRGFRSEWLWRTPSFLQKISEIFSYDTSVPTRSMSFTSKSGNGCGSIMPYLTEGGMVELPVTMPLDEQRHFEGLSVDTFWSQQTERAENILSRGGLVSLVLHPQPHQAANDETLYAFEKTLERLTSNNDFWIARPDSVAQFVAQTKQKQVLYSA
jgi:hypothetical protein